MLSEEFERQVQGIDEDAYHEHWCWVCNADWRCHDGGACEIRDAATVTYGEARGPAMSAKCPEHQWSADPEIKEAVA